MMTRGILCIVLLNLAAVQAHSADLLDPAGSASISLADKQLNNSNWAATNLLDDSPGSRWLSDRRDNDLIFQLDASGEARCFDTFTMVNYGSSRSVREFVLLHTTDATLGADTGTAGWTPVIADPYPSGVLNHVHWGQGGRITAINKQLNTTNWAAAHLNNGSLGDFWLSDRPTNTVDFAFDVDWDGSHGDAVDISQIALHNYGGRRSVRQFQVEVSQDGVNWQKLEVPGSNAGDADFNFALQPEGAALMAVDRQLNSTNWAAANIYDGGSQTIWLSDRANNTLDFEFDVNGDGTTGLAGDAADHFVLEKIALENYGSARSVQAFQVLVQTVANPQWTALPVPGSAAGTADYNFALSHQGGELTVIDQELNTSNWAAANIHDGAQQSIWLSQQANNRLDFAFDVDGDGSTAGAGDLYTLQKIALQNYGSSRSVQQFQVEVQTSATPAWTKLAVPGTSAGDPDFNFLSLHEGAVLTSVNSELNSTNWAGENAHDGSPLSRWLSDNPVNTLEFAFDTDLDGSTGDAVNFSTIRMQNYGSSRSVATFEIDVQIGGGPWQAVAAPGVGTVFTAVQDGAPQSWSVAPQTNVTAFRIRTLSNFGDTYTGFSEFEILGSSVGRSHTFTAAQAAAEQTFVLDAADQPAQVTAVRLVTINNYGDTYVGVREFRLLGESTTRDYTFVAAQDSAEQVFVLDPADRPADVTAVRLQTISNYGDTYTGVRELRLLGPSLGPSHTFTATDASARQEFVLDVDDAVTGIVAARFRTLSNYGDSYIGAREFELSGAPAGPSYLFNAVADASPQSWTFSSASAVFLRLHTSDNHGDSYTGASEVGLESAADCQPLGSWSMDETRWGNVYDGSGNNYQGSAANGLDTDGEFPVVPGSPGTCRYGQFDGSDDYIEVPGFPDLTGSFTIAAWIKPSELGNDQRIFADDRSNSGGYAFSLGDPGTGRLRFFSRAINPVSLDSPAVITQDTWHFVAVVHDADNKIRSIYVDGDTTPVAQGAYTGTWGTDNGPVSIGGEVDGTSEGVARWRFNGSMDEVQVYQRVLSGLELARLRDATHDCGSGGGSGQPAAAFNCFAPGDDALTGRLLTKLVGTPFTVEVAALRDADNDSVADGVERQFAQDADRTVSVELVDSSSGGACAALPALNPAVSVPVTFQAADNGVALSSDLTVNRAYPSLACRVSDSNDLPAVVGCSTDSFAVRPTSLTLQAPSLNNAGATGSPSAKVGSTFALSVSGDAGYDGSPYITADALEAHATAVAVGTLSGTFGAADATSGVASGNTFSYSEVGNFRFVVGGIRDAAFTVIDQPGDCLLDSLANSPDANGLVGCDVANAAPSSWIGRFTPDHFSVAITEAGSLDNTCTAFSYAGTDIGYLLNPQLLVTAKAGDGATTQNYTGAYNKLSAAEFAFETPTEDATTLGADGVTPIALAMVAGTPDLQDMGDGTLRLTLQDDAYTYQRVANNLVGEFIADVSHDLTAIVDSEDGTAATGLPLTLAPAGVAIRYGRLALDAAYGSELQTLPVPMRVEYFSAASNRFEHNVADSCTHISSLTITDADLSDSLVPGSTCIWDSAGSTGALACASPGDAAFQYSATPITADFNLNLAPTGGQVGVLQVGADAPDWLTYDWYGAGVQDPVAQITFGRYRGHDRIVYIREVR